MIKFFTSVLLFCISFCATAQKIDTSFLDQIYKNALQNGKAYEDLRSLCKDVGARLSGSAEAEMAVQWSYTKMKSYGFDTVYLQPIMVTHWERGNKEAAWIKKSNGDLIKLNILALGGSIGTNGLLEAEIVEFASITELQKATRAQVEGKIVFLSQAMTATEINTFKAYGACYPIRGDGAVEAGRLGAVAVIIRSLAMPLDDHPHTGSMHYNDSVQKIPAGAISTNDAEMLSKMLKSTTLKLVLEMDCRNFPPAPSSNVIGEIWGKHKNNIITFGGHLDSWDAGEGAHDDGAGCIHSLEALRLLKTQNYKPNNTLRCVLFMNEENGNAGGMAYAQISKEKLENHIAAIESDRGGFVPQGFSCDGNDKQVQEMKSIAKYFKKYEVYEFEKGYGGVDIGPLKKVFIGIPLYSLVPNSQRYFDFHHAESDVFESVNKRELELGAAGLASFVYCLDILHK